MYKAYLPAALIVVLAVFPGASAQADPAPVADYGNGCVIDPADPARTVDSLRFRCTATQGSTIYSAAEAGAVPSGVKNGWVTSTSMIEPIAPAFWIGKTFYTGPDGGRLMNRVTGAGIEGWPANVFRGPSRIDGKTTWALDYAPAVTPQVYDEIREVTPGVWLGYSWWRGALQTPLLLSFVLA
ncbi:hypothetical protein [Nocardia sp. NPDC024068]|uniref:hypothetical protein n=1 Tax=Nocardia sp. NPDC024068 TaxID=3157197 RepID=UPI0033C8D494